MFKDFFITVLISIVSFLSCTKSGSDNINKQSSGNSSEGKNDQAIFDLTVKTLDGEDKKLSDYKGKVLMIVNVASKCGYTKQYKGLEALYKRYKDKGFEILAFPCNDFGGQEPGTNDEIKSFCDNKYGITFPMFDKIHVLGESKAPLYSILINNSNSAEDIKWNFEKFIISKDGGVAARFKSKINPESEEISAMIETELSK